MRLSDVEKVVCDAFGLTAADLRSKSRRQAVACPRSLAMYVARKLTKMAYREIGMYFGGRDHSTVVAAEKRVIEWIESNAPINLPTSCFGRTFAEVVHELEERLLSLAS
ncbi:MAG: helix-turn-helix domain-containing protein [Planctomycetaceae bacterium]